RIMANLARDLRHANANRILDLDLRRGKRRVEDLRLVDPAREEVVGKIGAGAAEELMALKRDGRPRVAMTTAVLCSVDVQRHRLCGIISNDNDVIPLISESEV